MNQGFSRIAVAICLEFASIAPTLAHHSYAMFDSSKRMSITGTVAKVEWGNPRVFLWFYVRNLRGQYDL